MLNITNTYATIWKPESKGNFTKCNLGTSKKDKDGNWQSMYWNAKLVGKANVPVEEKQRVKIISGAIETRKYQDKYYYDVVIFEMELLASKSKDTSFEALKAEGEEQLPF